jgi:NADH dehydrogenase/NADH:ubiquinone oxidoreductase subunit G
MMPEFVKLTIDGRTIHANKEASVLEASLDNGICIPTLCHVPGLTPNGVCRLCIVELVEGKREKVTTSCTLGVKEGMEVRANSPKVLRLRRNIAEMLVAEAPNSKAIQDIAVRLGLRKVRYPFHNADCVQCGRCVRVCGEQWRSHALGFVGRGDGRKVMHPFGVRPESCRGEEACVDICPMTYTPCIGPMPPGEERLCGVCEAQTLIADRYVGVCVSCTLGKSFKCANHTWLGSKIELAKVVSRCVAEPSAEKVGG